MKRSKWQILNQFFWQHYFLFLISIISGIINSFVTILIPISLGKFYELIFHLHPHRIRVFEKWAWIRDIEFNTFIYLFFGLIILRFFFEYAFRYSSGYLGERFSKDLREQLFSHQLQVRYPIYEEKGIGKYLLRYSGDLKSVKNYLTQGILRFAQDLVLIFLLVGAITYISPRLAAIVVGVIAVVVLILWLLGKILFSASVDIRNRKSGLLSFVNTRLRAIISIKAFNKFTPEIKRYERRSKILFKAGLKYQKIIGLINSLIPAATYSMIGVLMIFIYSQQNIEQNSIPQGTLLILILFIIAFLPAIRRLLRVTIVWKLGHISFKKLINILELAAEEIDKSGFRLSYPIQLELKNLNFQYANTRSLTLKNVCLNLISGKINLLIGKTGSGKSTLIKLLTAIYLPTEGSIIINGKDYAMLSEWQIRKNITVISESFPLLGSTVYEAVTYSRTKVRKRRAEKMIKEVNQYMPKASKLGLDSVIGELGRNLTAGQKKVLQYCRAFLSQKSIIIIEKPFENVNAQLQSWVILKLEGYFQDKLIILFDTATNSKFHELASFQLKNGKINSK